jgi:hypothetical protein
VLSHLLRFQWEALLAMQPGALINAIARNAFLVLALVCLWRALPQVAQPLAQEEQRQAA